MKNKGTQVNLTELAATGTKTDLLLAEVLGTAKVTRLAPVKPRRSQLAYTAGTVRAGRNTGRPQKVG